MWQEWQAASWGLDAYPLRRGCKLANSLSVAGDRKTHDPLEQFRLFDLKVIAEVALWDFNLHPFRYLRIIECRPQVHEVGDASLARVAHVRQIPDRSANSKPFGYPTVQSPVIGDRIGFQVIPLFFRTEQVWPKRSIVERLPTGGP